jgi:hypothetical protein
MFTPNGKSAVILQSQHHAVLAGKLAALLHARDRQLVGLFDRLSLLGITRKNANHRRAENRGIFDPAFDASDLCVAFFARGMAKVVADRGAGNVEPESKALPGQLA